MFASTSTTSTLLFQEIFGHLHTRRLLLHTPLYQQQGAAATSPPSSGNSHESPSSEPYPGNNSFDANVAMVLSVLLCALICSLGLNSIIKCALRCSSLVASEPGSGAGPTSVSARLANTGIKKNALKAFPTLIYSPELKISGMECLICLSEFATGERVRVLPKCNHRFHVRCIDRWLNSHSSCPTCRHCLIETSCQKIVVGCSASQPTITTTPPLPQESVVRIAPLEAEVFIRNYEM